MKMTIPTPRNHRTDSSSDSSSVSVMISTRPSTSPTAPRRPLQHDGNRPRRLGRRWCTVRGWVRGFRCALSVSLVSLLLATFTVWQLASHDNKNSSGSYLLLLWDDSNRATTKGWYRNPPAVRRGTNATDAKHNPSDDIGSASETQDHLPNSKGSRQQSSNDEGKTTDSRTDPMELELREDKSGGACSRFANDNVQGILHIAMGDIGGAAATIFFQFVIAQILYAEQNRLVPFVHLNNVSYIVYDDNVHNQGDTVEIEVRVGRRPQTIRNPKGHWRDAVPGPLDDGPERHAIVKLQGTGVWDHYFEPISTYRPTDPTCQNVSYVTLSLTDITPGLHGFAPYTPKAWRYPYLPDYATQPHIPLTEWLEPHRVVGSRVAQQYLRLQPALLQQAHQANPKCSLKFMCLGLHVRHSDKASGRIRIELSEFLPYVQAFVHMGGAAVYLATDSSDVLEEVQTAWPTHIRDKIRTLDTAMTRGGGGSDVLRSRDETAVFDLHSHAHHLTNQQVLVEIAALSYCQFLVHGLSAVSEAAIWMSPDQLYKRSVNLEDPDRMGVAEFATLVQMVRTNESEARWPPTSVRTDDWWNASRYADEAESVRDKVPIDCSKYRGILHIASVGDDDASVSPALFTHILNQLLYAERHELLPWIYLDPASASNLYDGTDHRHASEFSGSNSTISILLGIISTTSHPQYAQGRYAGPPDLSLLPQPLSLLLHGNGIWESYFSRVSSVADVERCTREGLVTYKLSPEQVSPGLSSYDADAIRTWRYNSVPGHVWPQDATAVGQYYDRMRQTGHDLVQKYFRFRPYIQRHAARVNSATTSGPACLGVHFRNGDKTGTHRQKVSAELYLPYLQAFVDAGGESIFVASDSHHILQYLNKIASQDIRSKVRTQGNNVVRSAPNKKNPKATGWPSHMIGGHHRVNAETLVDILALSKCRWLVHTHSTVPEASIYLNLNLRNSSVNLEDPQKLTPDQFGEKVRQDLVEAHTTSSQSQSLVNVRSMRPPLSLRLKNATIVKRHHSVRGTCRTNAIVYLAQKRHSSYGRDSYSIFLKSLDLLYKNYLRDPDHLDNTDVFIFHTGDFNQSDLVTIESHLGPFARGAVHLVNLAHSSYWARPKANANEDPSSWYAFPEFSEGYRRMMHWYAIDIWRFFQDYNIGGQCQYRYIFRLDEDSFIHSPITYDVFDFFSSNQYVYGYRMCAYELAVAQRMWTWWKKKRPDFAPVRDFNEEACGFYNNFFVADLKFFTNPEVTEFLNFIDGHGHIYRRRLGDLMIHTLSVFAFAPHDKIHRFLDFTYEHGTFDKRTGCLTWGGIQAGYNDPNSSQTINDFFRTKVLDPTCDVNATFLHEHDLSPTYSHIPTDWSGRVSLHTMVRGMVETSAGKGLLSG